MKESLAKEIEAAWRERKEEVEYVVSEQDTRNEETNDVGRGRRLAEVGRSLFLTDVNAHHSPRNIISPSLG